MEFKELVQKRRSIRKFTDEKPSRKDIMKILEIVNLAPSAGNRQAYEVVYVESEETKRKIAEASLSQHFIAEAPVVLVFFANTKRSGERYGRRGEKLYSLQDATIACTYAHLAAVDFNLSSCWIGAFEDEKISKILNAPDYLKPVAILPIGFPAETGEVTSRRGVSNFLHEESL